MGAERAQLEGEHKARGHARRPPADCRLAGQPVEGVVDLDRVEQRGVVAQPAPLWNRRRVHHAAPVAVLPPRAAHPGSSPSGHLARLGVRIRGRWGSFNPRAGRCPRWAWRPRRPRHRSSSSGPATRPFADGRTSAGVSSGTPVMAGSSCGSGVLGMPHRYPTVRSLVSTMSSHEAAGALVDLLAPVRDRGPG